MHRAGSGHSDPAKNWGPQQGVFFVCVLVGLGSLLALDLHFAPAAIASDTGARPPSNSAETAPPPPANAVPPASTRAVVPAPARVPTIVARFESASKEPADETGIRALATAMIEDHGVSIVLEGHSDMRGGDDYNHTISLERANWVKSRLVALGVSAERIESVGLGATRPLRSDDRDGPSLNRRVEVRWLGSREGTTASTASTASGRGVRPKEAPPPPRNPPPAGDALRPRAKLPAGAPLRSPDASVGPERQAPPDAALEPGED